ncbi:MAG: hypothetical protein Q4D40_00960 [Eubacteriales bacterium]|nr:hypothetical protein [Eubacteriales bacterium]
MFRYLFIIGALCIMVFCMMTVLLAVKIMKREPVGMMLQLMLLLVIFAVMSFVLAYMLRTAV